MTKTERNKKMAVAVLRGYTYEQVGRVFGVTGTSVRLVVLRDLCRLLGYEGPFLKWDSRANRWTQTPLFPLGIEDIRRRYKHSLIYMLTK